MQTATNAAGNAVQYNGLGLAKEYEEEQEKLQRLVGGMQANGVIDQDKATELLQSGNFLAAELYAYFLTRPARVEDTALLQAGKFIQDSYEGSILQTVTKLAAPVVLEKVEETIAFLTVVSSI